MSRRFLSGRRAGRPPAPPRPDLRDGLRRTPRSFWRRRRAGRRDRGW
ncbi:hypothetical protein MBEBAB_1777 [Brevundimonas abyssalis TAR-001]|uniref:Uncharacterized protein n=1 Tax=Brevundimonas abyssalis TAR-001 TaxID=1391729 RepID=A0A8E0TRH4_9CAUL|nr:hypothetical protein MBEBAB_1777 [Brevundimonas abyssalis TAR-001]